MQRNMMRPPMQRQMPRSHGAMRNTRGPGGGGGSFLSNLFQKNSNAAIGNTAKGFSRGSGSTSTSFLQGLANPQKINSFLNQTQQVLGTAKQFGPMVQQYGPIVKNIPSMWKMYRAFKDTPVESEEEQPKVTENIAQKKVKHSDIKTENLIAKEQKGKSVPKLYIP